MTREEALKVLEIISVMYPKYVLTKNKVTLLLPQLKHMDYRGVLRKLSDYVAKYPYPPTIAEIAAYPVEPNKHLEQVRQWKQEAAQVPEEIKQKFILQLEKLMKEHNGE